MGGWQRLWLLGGLLAVAGCTSAPDERTPAVASEPTPSTPQPEPTAPEPGPETGSSVPDGGIAPPEDAGSLAGDAGSPPGDAGSTPGTPAPPNGLKCTPPESQDAGIPQLPDGGDPPTLAPSACVPCNQTPPEHEAQACEVISSTPQLTERTQYDAKGVLRGFTRTQADGKPLDQQQYDADGHLLESRRWSYDGRPLDGEPSKIERYTWNDGLLSQYTWNYPPSEQWNVEDWVYDAQRRPVTRTVTETGSAGPYVTLYQYVYEDERLTRVERQVRGETADLIAYQYDTAGRLVRTLSELGDGEDPRLLESRTYDEAGWLSELLQQQGDSSTRDTYDSLGRLLTSSWMGWEDSSRSAYVYDDAGHLVSFTDGYYGMGGGHDLVARYLYDMAGQLCLDWSVQSNWTNTGWEPTTRQTSRSTHLCDSPLLYMTETDSDGDGVVDSHCTYSRDPLGRLLLMQCSPLSDPSAFTSRIEYHYDCTP